jgi:2-phosphoglycerate kinase
LNIETDSVIFLIGGTSHSGKSTLGELLATTIHAKLLSTDSLARHPGRPWKNHPEVVPSHVQEHYSSLEVEAPVADVYTHYEKLWPTISSIIESHIQTSTKLVMEGSALLPHRISTIQNKNVVAIWLYAGADFLTERIRISSGYHQRVTHEQKLIDKFIARTNEFNKLIMKQLGKLKLKGLSVEEFASPEALMETIINTV